MLRSWRRLEKVELRLLALQFQSEASLPWTRARELISTLKVRNDHFSTASNAWEAFPLLFLALVALVSSSAVASAVKQQKRPTIGSLVLSTCKAFEGLITKTG